MPIHISGEWEDKAPPIYIFDHDDIYKTKDQQKDTSRHFDLNIPLVYELSGNAYRNNYIIQMVFMAIFIVTYTYCVITAFNPPLNSVLCSENAPINQYTCYITGTDVFDCCTYEDENAYNLIWYTLAMLAMFMVLILGSLFLLLESKFNILRQVPLGPFIVPRVAMNLCFAVVFWLYIAIKFAVPGFSCTQSRWGGISNYFAVSMEVYEFLMCLQLYMSVRGKTSTAVLIVDYRHSIAMVIAVILTIILWLCRGDGESNPFTCWQLHVKESVDFSGLISFVIPMLLVSPLICIILIYIIGKDLASNSFEIKTRIQLEHQYRLLKSDLTLVVLFIVLFCLVLIVTPILAGKVGDQRYTAPSDQSGSSFVITFYRTLYETFASLRLLSLFISRSSVVSFHNVKELFLSYCDGRRRTKNMDSEFLTEYVTSQCGPGTFRRTSFSDESRNSNGNGAMNSILGEEWKIDYRHLDLGFLVAKGGYSHVYKGTYFHANVAIKHLFTADTSNLNESTDPAFHNELMLLSRLHHPRIVQFIGACVKAPNLYLVTEWVERGSLNVVFNDYSIELNCRLIHKLANQIASGINYLHQREVIHRDIKPHNILITENISAKIGDFGLTRFISGLGSKEMTFGIGTPSYMAPEILDNKTECYDTKVDVYSFAIVLWQLRTRKPPYPDIHAPYALIKRVVMDELRPPIDPKWSKPFSDLLKDCWNTDPVRRPSFSEILKVLADPMIFLTVEPDSPSTPLLLAPGSVSPKHSHSSEDKSLSLEHYPRFNRTQPSLLRATLLQNTQLHHLHEIEKLDGVSVTEIQEKKSEL